MRRYDRSGSQNDCQESPDAGTRVALPYYINPDTGKLPAPFLQMRRIPFRKCRIRDKENRMILPKLKHLVAAALLAAIRRLRLPARRMSPSPPISRNRRRRSPRCSNRRPDTKPYSASAPQDRSTRRSSRMRRSRCSCRPTRNARDAVEAGLAVADSRFTYAIGKLVLWGKEPRPREGRRRPEGERLFQTLDRKSDSRALRRRGNRSDEGAWNI